RLVGAGLVAGVDGGLELEGGVLDVEVAGQAFLELVEQPGGVPVVEAVVLDDDVGGQGGEPGGDGPGVQVVHAEHVGDLREVRADLFHVHALGGGLQQDAPGVAQQLPRRLNHQDDHEEGGDGVGAGEPGGHDDDPGDDGADEPVQVGQHVPERALDVQAGAVGLGQHPGG